MEMKQPHTMTQPKQSKKAGHASSLMAGMATVPPSRRHRKGRLCHRKRLMFFSLKLQRNSQPNALLWIPPRGKLEKKPVCSPCGGDETTTYSDRAKRKGAFRPLPASAAAGQAESQQRRRQEQRPPALPILHIVVPPALESKTGTPAGHPCISKDLVYYKDYQAACKVTSPQKVTNNYKIKNLFTNHSKNSKMPCLPAGTSGVKSAGRGFPRPAFKAVFTLWSGGRPRRTSPERSRSGSSGRCRRSASWQDSRR